MYGILIPAFVISVAVLAVAVPVLVVVEIAHAIVTRRTAEEVDE